MTSGFRPRPVQIHVRVLNSCLNGIFIRLQIRWILRGSYYCGVQRSAVARQIWAAPRSQTRPVLKNNQVLNSYLNVPFIRIQKPWFPVMSDFWGVQEEASRMRISAKLGGDQRRFPNRHSWNPDYSICPPRGCRWREPRSKELDHIAGNPWFTN